MAESLGPTMSCEVLVVPFWLLNVQLSPACQPLASSHGNSVILQIATAVSANPIHQFYKAYRADTRVDALDILLFSFWPPLFVSTWCSVFTDSSVSGLCLCCSARDAQSGSLCQSKPVVWCLEHHAVATHSDGDKSVASANLLIPSVRLLQLDCFSSASESSAVDLRRVCTSASTTHTDIANCRIQSLGLPADTPTMHWIFGSSNSLAAIARPPTDPGSYVVIVRLPHGRSVSQPLSSTGHQHISCGTFKHSDSVLTVARLVP